MALPIEAKLKRKCPIQLKGPRCEECLPFPQDFRHHICLDGFFIVRKIISIYSIEMGVSLFAIAFIRGFSFISV